MSEFDISQVVQADFAIDSALDVQVGTFEGGAIIDDSVIAPDSTWSSQKMVNEFGTTIITGTLTAGQSSLTLTSSAITTSSMIDVYTDDYKLSPTNVVAETGSVTLSFSVQSNDHEVKVVIK